MHAFYCLQKFIYQSFCKFYPFSASTLLIGQQEGYLACKKSGGWFVGADILTGALHML